MEGLYYPCSENKGADQLRGHCEADLRLCFSHMRKSGFLTTRLIFDGFFRQNLMSRLRESKDAWFVMRADWPSIISICFRICFIVPRKQCRPRSDCT